MKKLAVAMGLALLAIPTGYALAKAPAKKAAVPTDWTKVVRKTGAGGYLMGNPAAKAKLVEYGSLTCTHCAAFERDGMAPLAALVKKGRVSYEYRQWVREPLDVASGLVARCAGVRGYFRAQAAVYEALPATHRAYAAIRPETIERITAAGSAQHMKSVAELSGLRALGLRLGIPAPRLDACIADTKAMNELAAMRRAGDAVGVAGTPAFYLNGSEVIPTQMDRWPDLERAIRTAIAG